MSTDGAHTCCDCGDEEIKRLRRRVHEVVDETQRRYAK